MVLNYLVKGVFMIYTALVKQKLSAENELARFMRQWREDHHKSVRAAAEMLGVAHSTWSEIERGERPASAGTLARLADLFSKPIDEIARMEGARSVRRSQSNTDRAARLAALIESDSRLGDLVELLVGLQGADVDVVLSLAESLRKRRE